MDANIMLDFYLESYKKLLKTARAFPVQLSKVTAEEILQHTKELQNQQNELRLQDALMLKSLKETDKESIDWQKVKECQELIQEVVDIFDNISIKAHTHKAMLADELKKVSRGLTGIKGYASASQDSGTLLNRSF